MSGFAFGAFCAYWTALVFFLEKPPYHYGAQMAGLLGLAGVAGALAAPAVGLLSDRGKAYAKAGADVIFIESPETVEEMLKVGKALSVPLVSNQLHGGRTPILPQSQLWEMGFSVAIYPTAGLFAASHALASVYASLANGKPVEAPLFAEFAAQGQI